MQSRRFRPGSRTKKAQREEDFFDYNLLAVIILLTAFGLVMQYSVSAYQTQVTHSSAFARQSLIALAGIAILIFVSRTFNYRKLVNMYGWGYVAAVVLVVATAVIGKEVNGAKRWIVVGPVQFQPAEVMKLAIILFTPVLIVKVGRNLRKLWATVFVGLPSILAFVLVLFLTKNLSSAIIILVITYAMILVSHPRPKWFVIIFIAAMVLAVCSYPVLKAALADSPLTGDFRMRRVIVWLDPQNHQKAGGYQVLQGLYAIGSGGLFGKGLGNSTQKLGALPEAENDMIFAIICEELGIVGAMIILALFVYLLYRLFFIAVNAPDLMGSLIVVGIFAHIAVQVVLNIAVVLNVIPTTGITLPFISFGGTSLLFLMVEMGIALSISGQIVEKKRKA